ncbi:MAG: alpha/beta hydrolase [Vulcanimicrobiaceae bacterium]
MQHDMVLVHGAFSSADVWQTLTPHLATAGARVTTLDLPGHTAADASDAGRVTLDDYVACVVRALDAAPSPVILVGHSMGGLPIAGAAEMRPEKIAALVFLCAILPESQKSLGEYGASDTQSRFGAHLEVDAEAGVARLSDAGKREVLCNRSDATATAIVLSYGFAQPLQPFGGSLVLTERFAAVPRYYIATTDDRAIGHDLQQRMIDARPCARVVTIDSDHMAMLSATRDVADALVDIEREVAAHRAA